MAEHTQPPWRVFTNDDGTKLVGIGAQDGQGILDCGFGVWAWNDPDGIANAELVVRAVNSHEALREALLASTTMLEALLVQLNSWGHHSAVNAKGQIDRNEELLASLVREND